MKLSSFILAAALALCAPSIAAGAAKHPESGARIAMAVSAAMFAEKSIYAGYVAIYIGPDDRPDALKDKELAPFVLARNQGSDDSAVLLYSPDRTDIVAVYFSGNSPSFIAHIHGNMPKAADVVTAIKPVDPASVVPPGTGWDFHGVDLIADDGAPLDAAVVAARFLY